MQKSLEFGRLVVFVGRSCAPDDAGAAACPGRGEALIRRTPCPPALCWALLGTWGSPLERPREKWCWHLVRTAAQHTAHSATQRNSGLGCWWRWALIGQGELDGEPRPQRMCLSCKTRLACGGRESRSGPGRVKVPVCSVEVQKLESS